MVEVNRIIKRNGTRGYGGVAVVGRKGGRVEAWIQ